MKNTSYSRTGKLIKKFGEPKLREVWSQNGMYVGAQVLSQEWGQYVSPYTMRYLSHKFNWKRVIDPSLPVAQGVIRGTVPADYYKHIIVEEETSPPWRRDHG